MRIFAASIHLSVFKKRIILPVLLVLFIASCGQKGTSEAPQRRDIVEVVYASGNLYPQNEYKVISNVTGYLQTLLVHEGDSVQSGDVLFTVSGPNRASEQQASAYALRIAEENSRSNSPVLAQLREKLAAARNRSSNDSLTVVRITNLVLVGAVAQAELDKVRTQWEISRRDVNALREQFQAQERSLNVEAVQARNRFTQAVNNLGDGSLRSMMHGRVYDIYKQVGDYVHQNEVIALLGDAGTPVARLSIDESDLLLVHLGQKVLITFDAYPDKTFTARVSKIYPKLNKAEQSFRVDAVFTDTPPEGIYGLNLEANILIRESKNALSIPRAAVIFGDSVMIERDGKKQTVKIRKGSSDLNYVEVLDGLNDADEILLNTQE